MALASLWCLWVFAGRRGLGAMLIPQYWARARVKGEINGRRRTVLRWGWSNVSQQDAEAHARRRAQEALVRIQAGVETVRREKRRIRDECPDGEPIREEVVARYGEAVLTRDDAGLLQLYAANVLVVDIPPILPCYVAYGCILVPCLCFAAFIGLVEAGLGWLGVALPSVAFLCAAITLWLLAEDYLLLGSVPLVTVAAVAAFSWQWVRPTYSLLLGLVAGTAAAAAAAYYGTSSSGDGAPSLRPRTVRRVVRRVQRWLRDHRDWQVALYETRDAVRIIALHRLFDPCEPEVKEFMEHLEVRSWKQQFMLRHKCFRVRASPCPERVAPDLGPAPKLTNWPPARNQQQARTEWVKAYNSALRGWAVCRPIGEFGSWIVEPRAQQFRSLHDRLCGADTGLPLA